MRKPDPEIYHLALKKLNCKPEEAIFLDDLGHNLKSARNLGITTIKVKHENCSNCIKFDLKIVFFFTKVGDPQRAIDELEQLLGMPLKGSSSFIRSSLAPPETTEVRKGMEISLNRLADYMKQTLNETTPENQILLRQYKHGQSNPTYFVGCGNRNYVLRKKPVPENQLFVSL